MNVLAILTLSLVSQTSHVSPIDAYHANFADIKSRVKYRFRFGELAKGDLALLRAFPQDEVAFKEDLKAAMLCEWSCDGFVQHMKCLFEHPEARPQDAPVPEKPTLGNNPTSPLMGSSPIGIEVLWDEEVQAEHRIGERDINVFFRGQPSMALIGRSPTCWWGTFRFPDSLRADFGKQIPAVHSSILQTFRVATEIYQVELSSTDWYRLLICYDPSVGYLPRYVISIAVSKDSAYCKELYLIDAKPCLTGGFVPLEWYETEYEGGVPTHPSATQLEKSEPPRPRSNVVVGHIKVVEFDDFADAPSLDQLESVQRLSAPGGVVALTSKAPLTMSRLKSVLGSRITSPNPRKHPTLDISEVNQFRTKPSQSWWPRLGIAAICLAACMYIWQHRRGRSTLALLALTFVPGLAGCNNSEKPAVHLSARFKERYARFDSQSL